MAGLVPPPRAAAGPIRISRLTDLNGRASTDPGLPSVPAARSARLFARGRG